MLPLVVCELIHFSIASLVAAFIYWKYKSWKLVIVCYVFGFLIDADHFLDYLILTPIDAFSLKEFFAGSQYLYSGKVFLWFHGYEYSAILLVLAWRWRKWRPVFLAAGLAILGHLLVDQFTNFPGPFTYFVTYRWLRNFQLDQLFFSPWSSG